MIPSPIVILAAVLFLAVTNAWTWAKATNIADTKWTAKIQTERAKAEADARATEQRRQEAANAITRRHTAEVSTVRRNLELALDSLRDRPERPAVGVPEAARADCAGGTGAELFRADAEFLAREAARADEQRAGLDACYRHIDTAMK